MRLYGKDSRSAITGITLIAGFASTVCWPLSAYMKFDVRYYLVAILFILFDLEIAFLFPWAVALREIGPAGFWAMMIFLLILVVGFAYEWKKGALDWE